MNFGGSFVRLVKHVPSRTGHGPRPTLPFSVTRKKVLKTGSSRDGPGIGTRQAQRNAKVQGQGQDHTAEEEEVPERAPIQLPGSPDSQKELALRVAMTTQAPRASRAWPGSPAGPERLIDREIDREKDKEIDRDR